MRTGAQKGACAVSICLSVAKGAGRGCGSSSNRASVVSQVKYYYEYVLARQRLSGPEGQAAGFAKGLKPLWLNICCYSFWASARHEI